MSSRRLVRAQRDAHRMEIMTDGLGASDACGSQKELFNTKCAILHHYQSLLLGSMYFWSLLIQLKAKFYYYSIIG